MKKLVKSYKFWTSFAGAVGVFLMALSDVIGIQIDTDGVKECIMAFCSVLIVFGIVKKPATKQNRDEIVLNSNQNEEIVNLVQESEKNIKKQK